MKAPIPLLWYGYETEWPESVPCHAADLPALLKSKLLITGGSGSGKSRALRSLCEQLAGWVQPSVDTSNPATDRHRKTGHHDR